MPAPVLYVVVAPGGAFRAAYEAREEAQRFVELWAPGQPLANGRTMTGIVYRIVEYVPSGPKYVDGKRICVACERSGCECPACGAPCSIECQCAVHAPGDE